MSCRKRCKREIFKFAQYLFRLVTGTLNTGKVDVLLPRRRWWWGGGPAALSRVQINPTAEDTCSPRLARSGVRREI